MSLSMSIALTKASFRPYRHPEGVKAGDRVVVDGAGFLGEGDRVRVVADAKAAAK